MCLNMKNIYLSIYLSSLQWVCLFFSLSNQNELKLLEKTLFILKTFFIVWVWWNLYEDIKNPDKSVIWSPYATLIRKPALLHNVFFWVVLQF